MKRVRYGVLFLLVGVFMPILIWVAFAVAIREPLVWAARRVGSVMLALLFGMLAPILIWVGFGVAIRQPLVWAARRVGSVMLALLFGMLAPILIWVGFSVAVRQWMRERMLQREPGRTVGVILAAAGLSVQWAAAEDRALEAAVFLKRPMPEIRGLLTRARLEAVRL